MEWHNTDGEWEMVNDDGFIFKRRKRRVEADVFPIAQQGQPEEDTRALSSASLNQQRKKQMLLAAKAKYTAELESWEKLAAATALDTSQESHLSPESSPSKSPPDQSLQSLHIEVLNMEQYILLLQDKIKQAETTYKLLVMDIREERNFRPADEIIRALTAPASMDPDATQFSTQTSFESSIL